MSAKLATEYATVGAASCWSYRRSITATDQSADSTTDCATNSISEYAAQSTAITAAYAATELTTVIAAH